MHKPKILKPVLLSTKIKLKKLVNNIDENLQIKIRNVALVTNWKVFSWSAKITKTEIKINL